MSYTLTLEPSEFSVSWLPPRPSAGANVEADPENEPSPGKRGLRVVARFLIALCIGVVATLAWQSYSDAARQMMTSSSPQLGWLSPPAAPVAQTAANVITSAPLSSDEQRLKAMSLDLASMRQSSDQFAASQELITRGIDQLAASQEQMTRDITRLQETERYILYKMSAPPLRPASAQARRHVPRPAPKATGAGPHAHHAATSSTSVGSSSPLPLSLTRRDIGHMHMRSSAAGLRSSAPAEPFSQALKSVLSRITGTRS